MAGQPAPVAEARVPPQLLSGMVLTREGILLLPGGHMLDMSLTEKIRGYEQSDANPMDVYERAMAESVPTGN